MRAWVVIAGIAGCARAPDPPAPPGVDEVAPERARALSAREYRNTVTSLFGAPLADDLALPVDAVIDGYDDQQAGFTASSSWVAAYEAAAGQVAARALAVPAPREHIGSTPIPARVEPHDAEPLNWEGRLAVPSDGTYRLTFTGLYVDAPAPIVRQVMVDGQLAGWVTFGSGAVEAHAVDVDLTAGERTFALWTPRTDPGSAIASTQAMSAVIEGPVDPDVLVNPVRDALLVCDPAEPGCARAILDGWLPRAWRRPVDVAEVDRLVALVDGARAEGATPDEALQDALHAALAGPSFLVLAEGGAWGLASRLSYLVWAAPPDDGLRALAASGALEQPDVLAGELDRLLADPRAGALVDGFGWQWLQLARMDDMTPSLMLYPTFDAALRDAMKEQARRFLGRYLLGDADLRGLVDASVAWVDERLAAHEGVVGTGEVDRAAAGRFGLPGLSGVEAMLSHPDRTSPTRRGAWLLDRLLCDAPGPPPQGLPALPQDTGEPGAIGDALAAHAADPGCSVCHARTDPPGLAMEAFDAIGRWRDVDVSTSIDGAPIEDPADLAAWLRAAPGFEPCVARHAFTWAVGRAPDAEERDAVAAAWRDGTFRGLLRAVVASPAFLAPRGTP